MKGTRLTPWAVTAAIALLPAAAFAASGEDQYCDPFEGCGGSGQTGKPKPGKGKPEGSRSGGASGTGGGVLAQARTVEDYRRLQLDRLASEASRSDADPAAVEAYRNALKLRNARAVLEAAGLSSLGLTLR